MLSRTNQKAVSITRFLSCRSWQHCLDATCSILIYEDCPTLIATMRDDVKSRALCTSPNVPLPIFSMSSHREPGSGRPRRAVISLSLPHILLVVQILSYGSIPPGVFQAICKRKCNNNGVRRRNENKSRYRPCLLPQSKWWKWTIKQFLAMSLRVWNHFLSVLGWWLATLRLHQPGKESNNERLYLSFQTLQSCTRLLCYCNAHQTSQPQSTGSPSMRPLTNGTKKTFSMGMWAYNTKAYL